MPPLTGPPYIQTLDMKRNRLRSLGTDSFSAVPTTTYLILNDNEIEDIGIAAFRGLPRLKQINLKANRIRILRTGIFQDISQSIKFIYLQEVIL